MRLIDKERLVSSTVSHSFPYPHVVIDNFLPQHIADALAEKFPDANSTSWFEYDNPLERKRAQPDMSQVDPLFEDVINELNGQSTIKWLEQLMGMTNLVPDPGLNGGGLHLHLPNQHLDLHLDYTHHYLTGLKRVCNIIVYLNKISWKEEYGGMLEIWDGNGENAGSLVRTVAPIHNRAVIFATSNAVHGVGSIEVPPLHNGASIERRSIALYYYQNDGTAGKDRVGTRFLARPGEQETGKMELRERRKNGRV